MLAGVEAMVVLLVFEGADSETQRTWPIERSQFESSVGLNAYS